MSIRKSSSITESIFLIGQGYKAEITRGNSGSYIYIKCTHQFSTQGMRVEYADIKEFAELIANVLDELHPETKTVHVNNGPYR